jgi:hypothetical protein
MQMGTVTILQDGTMNDEYLSGYIYSSFVIFNPSKVPAPFFIGDPHAAVLRHCA